MGQGSHTGFTRRRLTMGPSIDLFKGVKEVFKPESETDSHAEEVSRNGYTILNDVLDETSLELIRKKIDALYETQLQEIGGEKNLREIFDWDSVKHLIIYDDLFLNLARNEKVLAIVNKFLGDYFILNLQNGIINRPNVYNPASLWHRDLFYQHYCSSRPLAISALLCVDSFTIETGGTFLLPGSHQHESFPSVDFAKKFEKQISTKAGSILLFDSMVFHRAGFNKSSEIRRAISNVYTLPLIKQQVSLPKAFKGKYKDDPELSKFLGYDSETPDSLYDWRIDRLKARAGTGYTGLKEN
jgi:ectoine hydroxylase-related dioxygenase (phytanoyl-CoA dioxygenase family)